MYIDNSSLRIRLVLNSVTTGDDNNDGSGSDDDLQFAYMIRVQKKK